MQKKIGLNPRPDFLRRQRVLGDERARDRVLAHYVLERELSDRLRSVSRETRALTYTEVYKELFATLPDHPQRRATADRIDRVEVHLRRLVKQLESGTVFLEIGCGDAALSFAVAKKVNSAYSIDVTDELIDFAAAPANFRFLRTDGIEIPLPTAVVDLAYSNQLIEHLHPQDAADQLREIYRVLKPGGRYVCITPSRVTGPHDISCYFDYEATCLHLREYDYGALRTLFIDAGFRYFTCSVPVHGRDFRVPYKALRALELALLWLPAHVRARFTKFSAVQAVLGLNVIAAK